MLVVRSEAENDLAEAHQWYYERHPDLGREFLGAVDAVFQTIETDPKLYASVFRNVRRAFCRRFPYSVYYLETGLDVVVIAVLHQRRNPAVWQLRA